MPVSPTSFLAPFLPYRSGSKARPVPSRRTAHLPRRVSAPNVRRMKQWFLCALAALIGCGAGAAAETTNALRTVVVLGDSLAAGYGVDPEEAFPALLGAKIREAGLPFAVVNAGVSGDTTAGGARRIDWLLRRPVDVLLLELGGNDGLRGIPPASTRTNLQTIIDKTRARNPRVRIVLAGMQVPSNMGREFTEEFSAIFPALAAKNDAALIPFLLEGVGGDPKLNLPDLIHPTAEGHRILAENCWKVLRPLLEALATEPDQQKAPEAASQWSRSPTAR